MSTQPPRFEPDPVVEAFKKDIDRTLLQRNLQLTPSQRVERFLRFHAFSEELRRAGEALRKRQGQDRGRVQGSP